MNKKISIGVAITLMAIAAAITFSITMISSQKIFNSKVYDLQARAAMYDKIYELDTKIRDNFNGQIDESKLNESIARAFISGIGDKYGSYYTAAQYAEKNDQLSGKSAGIGVEVIPNENGYILIYNVIAGTPAQTAGIKPGDLIVSVGGQDVTSLGYSNSLEALKGSAGSSVSFVVRRAGSADIPFTVSRVNYTVPSVEYKVINGNIGYIKIKEFNSTTDEQFESALNDLASKKVAGLVFDVRNNGGGTLESTSKILDRLVPAGNIVSATYKDGHTDVLYTSDNNEINLPMTVLMNNKTASAAELFAAVLKDYGKAITVGTQTYGKATMQVLYPLNDGSALNLSVALVNPPKTPNYEGVGLKPDYIVKLTEEQEKNFYFMTQEEDSQLRKALDIVALSIKGQALPNTDSAQSSSAASSTASKPAA